MKEPRESRPGPRPPLRVHRYHWPADEANGFEETELIFDGEGTLVGIDYRPQPIRPGGPRLLGRR